jgi:uncharacterized protein YjiK
MTRALKTAWIGSASAIIIAMAWVSFRGPDSNSTISLMDAGAYAAYGLAIPGENNLTVNNPVVEKKWNLPGQLREVSGISYIGKERLACIQDEEGKIFIYHTGKEKVEEEIDFGPSGDYEGIAIVGQTAFVVRSDGTLYEVQDYRGKKPVVRIHETVLTAKHNVEGLCYDEKNNRLLLAIKGKEAHTDAYKGIYAFDLKTSQLSKNPVYKIDLEHKIWKEVKAKKDKDLFQPSGIAIHPQTGDIYIVEGSHPKLLIMDRGGKIKALHPLTGSAFEQPEGITFSPSGEMYISNEGGKGQGNILLVNLQP